MIQLGEFPGRFLGPLLKTFLLLIGNVFKPAKSVLVTLELTATASPTDSSIQSKVLDQV